jgi:protein-S-isoprenylcysteine O-methyltransferase Ste14
MSLGSKLALRCAVNFVIAGATLFLPAGSPKFWQGWALLGVLSLQMVLALYFLRGDPEFMKRRLRTREEVPAQRRIMHVFAIVFFAGFLLPGLDYRFGWSRRWIGPVPPWLTVVALAGIFLSYSAIIWVFKYNRFASRTVTIEEGQTVISDGPYRLIRHPQYFFILLMMLSVPLALGSYVALPVFALIIPVTIWRLLNEEKVLLAGLPGYQEYCRHTRYRLVPSVW